MDTALSEAKANIMKYTKWLIFTKILTRNLQKMSLEFSPELIDGVWALLPKLTGDGVKQDSHQCQ